MSCKYNQNIAIRSATCHLIFAPYAFLPQPIFHKTNKITAKFNSMGITSSTSQQNDPLDISDYTVVERQTDCLILRQQDSDALFKYREFYFSEREGYEQIMKHVKKHKKHQFSHILNIVSLQNNIISNVCSSNFHIGLVMEHSPRTLENQIRARNAKSMPFSQSQLLQILTQFVSASHQLLQVGIQSVIPKHVYLVEGGLLKFNGFNMDNQYDQVYYSPQRFEGTLYNSVGCDSGFSPQKQLMFSVGIMMISVALLQNCLDCYDFKEGTMRLSLLEDKLDRIESRYSNQMTCLLQQMVQVLPNKRLSFGSLADKLSNFQGRGLVRKPFDESPIRFNQMVIDSRAVLRNESRKRVSLVKLRPKTKLDTQFKISPIRTDKIQNISSTTATDYLEDYSVSGSISQQENPGMTKRAQQKSTQHHFSIDNKISDGIVLRELRKPRQLNHSKLTIGTSITSTPNRTKETSKPPYVFKNDANHKLNNVVKHWGNEWQSSTVGTRHPQCELFQPNCESYLERSWQQKSSKMPEKKSSDRPQPYKHYENNIY